MHDTPDNAPSIEDRLTLIDQMVADLTDRSDLTPEQQAHCAHLHQCSETLHQRVYPHLAILLGQMDKRTALRVMAGEWLVPLEGLRSGIKQMLRGEVGPLPDDLPPRLKTFYNHVAQLVLWTAD